MRDGYRHFENALKMPLRLNRHGGRVVVSIMSLPLGHTTVPGPLETHLVLVRQAQCRVQGPLGNAAPLELRS